MYHNFHILSFSCYPYLVFLSSFGFFSGVVVFFKFGIFNYFCFFVLLFVCFLWFKDICLEGLCGYHNFFVRDGFKLSLLIFIFSEFMFFFGIFWSYFDFSISPVCDFGDNSLTFGLFVFSPFGVPLLNSCILLSSAVTVTWCHYSLLMNMPSVFSLFLTLFLCLYFLFFQFFEYVSSFFSISDGVFGSIFFFSTGFHGLHVFFGGIFLFFNYVRFFFSHFSFMRHLSFEFAIIYWHFVDVVWLFLYVFIYWWIY